MEPHDFPIEFHTDFTDADRDLYTVAENKLRDLGRGHDDITGAAITIEKPAQGRETDYIYEANVVVYVRPNNIAATEKRDSPEQALKGALDAVERQVREKRDRLQP